MRQTLTKRRRNHHMSVRPRRGSSAALLRRYHLCKLLTRLRSSGRRCVRKLLLQITEPPRGNGSGGARGACLSTPHRPPSISSPFLAIDCLEERVMPRSRDGKHTFCVYGSSSVNTPQPYLDVARKLGNLLADGGHTCVNGAGRAGCMGALNDGVTERCGRVRGVIHEMWIVDASEHPQVKDLRVVGGQGLQERKRMLMEGSDCIVALPGGLGTWDELWEMVCLKGIGLCDVPICVLDVDDFYAGFKVQTKRAQADRLLYADMDKLLHFESDPAKAIEWCVSQLRAPGRDHKPNRRLERTTSGVNPPTKKSWRNSDRLLWASSVIACSGALTLAMTALRR